MTKSMSLVGVVSRVVFGGSAWLDGVVGGRWGASGGGGMGRRSGCGSVCVGDLLWLPGAGCFVERACFHDNVWVLH